jgi:hypothetical protein
MIGGSGLLGAGTREPLCVALTQAHRGHGVSTAAYYLGRALVACDLHVLLGDLSERSSPLAALVGHVPVKNLVPWRPPVVGPSDLPAMLRQARQRTAGRADVVLLDIDAGLLEHGAGLRNELSYLLVLTDPTSEAARAAGHLAERFQATAEWLDRVGAVFSRVDPPNAEHLPERLGEHIPVLGWLPADYLLAAGETYSVTTGAPTQPHDAYLNAITRLAQALTRLVPLAIRRQPDTPAAAHP